MSSTKPNVRSVTPAHSLPGGRLLVHGDGFQPSRASEHRVIFGDRRALVNRVSKEMVSVIVPDGAMPEVVVEVSGERSNPLPVSVGSLLASELHIVANPVVDKAGTVFTTVSGPRGQKVPVSVFAIDPDGDALPYASEVVNPTGLALGPDEHLYVSSRHDGCVYRVSSSGSVELVADELGIATGLAFDREGILYVGDRRGTIFRIEPNGEPRSFCQLEPSVAAYHLAFDRAGNLFVTAPSLATVDRVYRVAMDGAVSVFADGFGRPQGLAFDKDGNLYVAEGLLGESGIYRLSSDGEKEQVVSGPPLVGMAFHEDGSAVLAGMHAVFRIELGIEPQRSF